MRAPPCLATARLRLRPRRREDIDAILQMDLDPEVYRYSKMLPSIPLKNPDPATLRETIRSQIKSCSPRDFWVVEWKNQPGLLGLAGLNRNPKGFGKETNVLEFRFVRTTWGQGIASEAAQAILDHGFRVLKFPTIVAFSHTENWRSRRVLEKIGMKQDQIAVIEQRSLLSAPQSPAPARVSNLLNIKCSTGIRYLVYRLERRTYLDRGGPPTASPAQPELLR
jgi:RimJ/RimL family protein N-acetyltransferase